MKKRTIVFALLLTLLFVLLCTPAVGAAAEEIAGGTCGAQGDNLTWSLTDDGTLTITGEGEMKGFYPETKVPWYQYRTDIEKLEIEPGVESISSRAFYECDKITEVKIPEGVRIIGTYAFYNCINLKSVVLPDSLESIITAAFEKCSGLKEVHVSSLENWLDIELFYSSNPLIYAKNGLYIDGARLKGELNIPEGTEKISSYAFIGYSDLTSVTIPNSVTCIGEYAFVGCDHISSMTVPFVGSSVDDDSWDFDYFFGPSEYWKFNTTVPETLKSVTVTNAATIGMDVFRDCEGIETIILSDTVKKIGAYAFSNCSSLKSFVIPDSVEEIGYRAFLGCKGLQSIVIPDRVTNVVEETFYGCSGLEEITIPDTVTTIDDYAFVGCSKLKSITIPDSVTTIGHSVFRGCYGLDKISFPKGITKISDYMFYGCSGFEDFEIPDTVTDIGEFAFKDCTGLKMITIPKGVSTIGIYAFSDCDLLETIKFEGNAPTFEMNKYGENKQFDGVDATAHYPCGNDAWTTKILGQYGGWIKWEKDHKGEEVIDRAVAPTCTKTGLTEGEHCSICNDVILAQESVDALGHSFVEGMCSVCGANDLNYFSIQRIAGTNRFETAFKAADELKKLTNVDKFDTVIVASGMNYADALSGSYLAKVKEAPILLVQNGYEEAVAEYIDQNMVSEGKVYILGGEGSVSKAFETMVLDRGYDAERLSGKTRFDTNLAILEEAGIDGKDLLVCSGLNFADALSASAVGNPILLVGETVSDVQMQYLRENDIGEVYLIGGTGSVSAGVEEQLKEFDGEITRVSGANRFTTSIAVAEEFFGGELAGITLAYGLNFPDGLSGAPVAHAINGPLILARDNDADISNIKAYAEKVGMKSLIVFGGSSLISDENVNKIIQ